MRSIAPLEDRFWSKVSPEPNSGCWLWTAGLNDRGYGTFNHGYAHRWAYTHFVGDIPAGLDIDHLCRTRCCVNPQHMEPVTRSENARRGAAHGTYGLGNRRKTHCPYGHEYTSDNTRIGRGRRHCITCIRLFGQHHRTRDAFNSLMRASVAAQGEVTP